MELVRRIKESRWTARLIHHFPPGQFGRYLAVGAGNTLFGYGTYAGLTAVLTPLISHGYILAAILSAPLNITFSYLGYKLFVFKTRGNYLREWSRCIAVYGSKMLLGVCLLPVVVFLVRWSTGLDRAAPYIGGALMMGTNVVYSFAAHKRFTFQPAKSSKGELIED